MKVKTILSFLTLTFGVLLLSNSALAQRNVADSLVFSPQISFNYGYQIPAGDMAQRFGNNSSIGLSFHIKDDKNWFYGVEGVYIFGTDVTEPGLLQNLLTENGEIISNQGEISEILIQERGFMVTANGGKLFSLKKTNPNSGILIKGGIGFMQHKIRIENQIHTITQLEDEYLKGYDRLTNGLALSEFVGYYHMSDNRLANFYVGFESYQAFTRGRRDFNFDTQTVDDQARFDMLIGVRAGWVIHIYKRTGREYYYD
ncbi:hypothetical protein [Sanyastnella coralliicola]|uniref:hypothetical protein n=1 Tax=Sanyastnella coralliicola TaxID=3069118 RepID=UPI0027BADEC3|nr:hypothetical protein [Longitalea sp. SCSIO 12813]